MGFIDDCSTIGSVKVYVLFESNLVNLLNTHYGHSLVPLGLSDRVKGEGCQIGTDGPTGTVMVC